MKKLLAYVALGLLPMLFFKCTLKEDLNKLESTLKDSVQLYIGTPKFTTLAHIEFVDAVTNLPIDDKDIKVAITGKDSAVMYNNVGTQMKEYTAKWGMLDLVADPHKIDTSALMTTPVEFLVTPILAGYEANPQLVLLINPNENSITIPMTKVSSGETVNVNAGNTDANGEIGGDVTINLAQKRNLRSSSASTGGSLNFLTGTTLLSSSGTKLVGTVITNFTIYYWNSVRQVYFKGNLNFLRSYRDISIQFSVKSATGVITKVAKFGKGGVIYTYPVIELNDQTNAPFKVGDEIDRWVSTGSYYSIPSSSKDVVSLENGVRVVKAILTNISDLNSRWGSFQPASLNITKLIFNGVVSRRYPLLYYYIESNGRQIMSGHLNTPVNGDRIVELRNYVYSGKQTKFTLKDFDSPAPYLSTFNPSTFSTGGGGTFSQIISFVEPLPVTNILAVNVDLSVVKLSSPNLAIKPNANLQVGVAGAMSVFKLIDGKANFSLKLGQVYVVRGAFGTASGQGTLSVVESGANYLAKFILPIGSTPGKEFSYAIPKTADKTININYTIPVSDDVFNQMKQK